MSERRTCAKTWSGFAICTLLVSMSASPQEPAYKLGQGPAIVVDADYKNTFSEPLVTTITQSLGRDGYRIEKARRPFDQESLRGKQLLIIAGALARQNEIQEDLATATEEQAQAAIARAWRMPTPSAFSREETEYLKTWVESGGSLWIALDHMPFAGAVEPLARQFGVVISNGIVADSELLGSPPPTANILAFERTNGSIGQHFVSDGRDNSERVNVAAAYGAAAFRLPANGTSLLNLGEGLVSVLSEVSGEVSEATPKERVDGWSVLGVFSFGRGRVAVSGDLALFFPPFPDEGVPLPGGVKSAHVQNSQLVLNTAHWLSGLPDE
jgi:hypothetical protein